MAAKKVVTQCTESQKKHLLSRLDWLGREEVVGKKPSAKQVELEKKRSEVQKELDKLNDLLHPLYLANREYRDQVKAAKWEAMQLARTAIYFKSAAEALAAVEDVFKKFPFATQEDDDEED